MKDIFKNKKFNRSLILLAIVILLFITPVGKYLQVQINKIGLLFSNAEVIENPYLTVTDEEFDSFMIQDLNGKTIRFSEAKNAVLFINLWATWCYPCIIEMPSIEKLYTKYKDDVQFYMLSNEKLEKLQEFIQTKNFSFPVYKPLNNLPRNFKYKVIPKTIVVDKKGNIRISQVGSYNWNSKKVHLLLDELLLEQE